MKLLSQSLVSEICDNFESWNDTFLLLQDIHCCYNTYRFKVYKGTQLVNTVISHVYCDTLFRKSFYYILRLHFGM